MTQPEGTSDHSAEAPAKRRVLVTGAFGNIGSHAVPALLEAGHAVRALSHLGARADRTIHAGWTGPVEFVVGDVRDRGAMDRAVAGCDTVVHLAYLIPPPALEQPELARSINVDGTSTLLDAVRAAAPRPRLLFASTLDVYGPTLHLPPPRRVTDPLVESDAYSGHKIACERRVREAAAQGLIACILRFADVPPIAVRGPHPMMFRVPLATRIEMIHPVDAGFAVARAVDEPRVWSGGGPDGEVPTLHIGGGASCQLTYRQYLGGFLDTMGVGMLPDEAFSTEPYCTDWLDTEESQRLLGYQRRTYDDVVRETAALLGWRRPLARLFRPLVRAGMLRLSPHYRAARR